MNIQKLPSVFWRYLTDKKVRFHVHAKLGLYNKTADEGYLEKMFQVEMNKPLDLEHPVTFNEKLQWLKLHDRKPEYTIMVDKYLARQHVAQKIGSEYLIPLLGVWDHPNEINFDALPNQFVLKCNHNSGLGMCICTDNSSLDIAKVKKELNKGLKQNYYLTAREWPYKNVPRKIVAEAYIQERSENTDTNELKDYKFMCFNGKVKCSFVCSDRFSEKGLHVTFFNRDWQVMPFERHYPSVKEGLPKPKNYEKMIELAEILSKDIPFVRVDFYEVDGKVYFGELTFYPGAGFEEFTPEIWDETLGSWIELPPKS